VGDNIDGTWYVDPVLLLHYASPQLPVMDATPLPGRILKYDAPAPSIEVIMSSSFSQQGESAITFTTTGSARFYVEGSVGDTIHILKVDLDAYNSNTLGLQTGTTTIGEMTSNVSMTSTIASAGIDDDGSQQTLREGIVNSEVAESRRYPYTVISEYTQTAQDFQIYGFVDYGIQVLASGVPSHSGEPVQWELHMVSNATYNRTNDYVYNIEANVARERFTAFGACFEQTMDASNGYVTLANENNACSPAINEEIQKDLCGAFDVCAPNLSNISHVSLLTSGGAEAKANKRRSERLLFRFPRHIESDIISRDLYRKP